MGPAEPDDIREPKYYTVKRHLLDLVAPLSPGDAIPTERELAKALSTSRTTVRQALVDMVAEGRLVRRQGAGTFIAEPKTSWPLHLASFTEQAVANRYVASTTLLSASSVRATGEVASRLGLRDGRAAFRIERLRLADGQPIAVEASYLSAVRFPHLTRLIRKNDSLYALLREHFGVVPARAEEFISTSPAPPREARLLSVETGAPMLVRGRHSLDGDDAPIEWVTSWCRGDRVTLVADLVAPD